jgi:VRR-NUC domain-containing protein
MCTCDQKVGRRFLAHQLHHGTDSRTREEVPVTLGFQPAICRECRSLPAEAFPMTSVPGRTSKIRRYYWRELWFQTMERFAAWADAEGLSSRELATSASAVEAKERIRRDVLEELKRAHATSPKYVFREESQEAVIRNCRVEVVRLDAIYTSHPDTRGILVLDGHEACSAEEYVARHYRRMDFETLFVESTPLHVLFGVFMWLLIQDVSDPMARLVGFSDRAAFEAKALRREIWTLLPKDFGSPGYAKRRGREIDRHLARLPSERDELIWSFGYWLEYSVDFRQYLWAHREQDVARARRLLDVLPAPAVSKILKYLVDSYWQRYCGWPDLLVYKNNDFFFAEVKSSSDKLNEAQKRWIKDNHEELHLPFKLVKIHKSSLSFGSKSQASNR